MRKKIPCRQGFTLPRTLSADTRAQIYRAGRSRADAAPGADTAARVAQAGRPVTAPLSEILPLGAAPRQELSPLSTRWLPSLPGGMCALGSPLRDSPGQEPGIAFPFLSSPRGS